MRASALVLVAIGAIGGVLSAAPSPERWLGFLASLVALSVGLLLLRAARHRTDDASRPAGEWARWEDTLAVLEREGARLASEASDSSLIALRERLDHLISGPLLELGIAAPAIRARLGLERWAAFAVCLARAERQLHRSWSAAVDGHREEAVARLPTAFHALEAARGVFSGARTDPPA